MSKSGKKEGNTNLSASSGTGRRIPPVAVLVLAVALVAAVGFWWGKSWRAGALPMATPTAEAPPALQKLKGRWLRPDGGYIIEIRSVEAGGKMDAAYFNPRPINVSKAEASQDGETVRVFIELRDVNYPGSTYMLSMSADADQMSGTYYQAVTRETYDVVFVRQ